MGAGAVSFHNSILILQSGIQKNKQPKKENKQKYNSKDNKQTQNWKVFSEIKQY